MQVILPKQLPNLLCLYILEPTRFQKNEELFPGKCSELKSGKTKQEACEPVCCSSILEFIYEQGLSGQEDSFAHNHLIPHLLGFHVIFLDSIGLSWILLASPSSCVVPCFLPLWQLVSSISLIPLISLRPRMTVFQNSSTIHMSTSTVQRF